MLLLLQSPWAIKSVGPKPCPSFAVEFGESGPFSAQTSVPFLEPRAETLCCIRTSLAPRPICTYSKSERNWGKDLGYRKMQCPIKRGQITGCVCSDYFNKLKVGAGGRIVNEACITVEGGGKLGWGCSAIPKLSCLPISRDNLHIKRRVRKWT